jgi:hypothetical protein
VAAGYLSGVSEAAPPWFLGRAGQFLVFRVNRRPLLNANLFAPSGLPSDVFEHFTRVLAPGHPVVSGRGHQRTWRVGGIHVDEAEKALTGRLGWQPREEEVVAEWSEETKDWTSSTMAPRERKLMPFGFDGEKRLLTVLSDRESAPPTIAAVFEKILRENERELLERTTDWSVEPVLDAEDFLSWLERLDTVTSVSFQAKLPNPEPREAFADLAERMTRNHATHHRETIRSERDEGLLDVQDDRDVSQAIAMGEQGFATLQGRGRTEGHPSQYSQKQAIASERVPQLPTSWDDVRQVIVTLLKTRLRRFLDKEEAA